MTFGVVKSDVERGFRCNTNRERSPYLVLLFRVKSQGLGTAWTSNGPIPYPIPSPPTDTNLQPTMSSSTPYDNDAHSINEDDLIDPDDGMLFDAQCRTTLTGCQISMT